LAVLKKTFLIESAKNRLRSVRSQSKSLDKIFSVSTNLAAAALSIGDPLNPPCLDFRGHIIENFIYNCVKKIGNVYYYRKAGKEIDFIVEAGNEIIPLEVKSAEIIKKTDANHLVAFMKKNNLRRGYLVYGGDLKIMEIGDKKIYLLPYRIF
jgi:predicted AAA+ superfamily ATPase